MFELEEEEDDDEKGEEDSERAERDDEDPPNRVMHRHPQRHVVLVHHALSTIHALNNLCFIWFIWLVSRYLRHHLISALQLPDFRRGWR